MAHLKPLRPTLKERKRYVVFEVFSEQPISNNELINAINEKCLEFMGMLYFGKAGIILLKNQLSGNRGIIKVNHRYVDHLKSALMLIKEINKKKVSINAIGVSGIIKKAREKFIYEKQEVK